MPRLPMADYMQTCRHAVSTSGSQAVAQPSSQEFLEIVVFLCLCGHTMHVAELATWFKSFFDKTADPHCPVCRAKPSNRLPTASPTTRTRLMASSQQAWQARELPLSEGDIGQQTIYVGKRERNYMRYALIPVANTDLPQNRQFTYLFYKLSLPPPLSLSTGTPTLILAHFRYCLAFLNDISCSRGSHWYQQYHPPRCPTGHSLHLASCSPNLPLRQASEHQ
ncbi:hypothetical protein GGR56DRAFT_441829 [Xylariaceae sp. FL0804]|nr:hypothetical protein GGR56DRAFT_441829 [Xylariaceae sp. FL0804]